ncbi:hypothetical protein ACN4EK_07235 [Pantanalinema rosaneae CENA516]|uniref:hypothetical protein n=1 Tax=Pantanalinema rosaneae TaxID=1620701 RepID=UPI003D6E114C
MDRIQAQATKVLQLITSADTFATYQGAVAITWKILVEAALLVWLTVCLVLVVFEWGWQLSVGAGRNARSWWDSTLSTTEGSGDRVASEAGKALLTAGKNSLDFTITQAKSQLGLPTEPQSTDSETRQK